MKTKEFIGKMNEVASAKTISSKGIHIYNLDKELIGWVDVDEFGPVDTSYESLDTMKNKDEVIKLIFEYAPTPLDEREDELKFRVRMLPEDDDDWEIYLNLNKSDNHVFIDDSVNCIPDSQTIFTKSEYDKLQQKYHDWLPK